MPNVVLIARRQRGVRRSIRWLGWALIVGAIIPTLQGCGFHIYNEADHKAALKAQSSFADAKVSEALVAERARLEALLKSELEAVRRFALVRRETPLIAVLAGNDPQKALGEFRMEVDDRFLGLLDPAGRRNIDTLRTPGQPEDVRNRAQQNLEKALAAADATAVALDNAAVEARTKREDMQWQANTYRIVFGREFPGKPLPTLGCPLGADPTETSVELKVALTSFKESCQAYVEATKRLHGPSGTAGPWRSLLEQIEAAETARAKIQGDLRARQEKYKTAKEAYEKAAAPSDIKARADDLKKKLEDLGQPDLAGVPPQLQRYAQELGSVAKLEEQLGSVNKLLGAFADGAGGEAAPATKERVELQVARTIGGVAAAMDEASRIPNLGVLLLESRRLELELEQARRSLVVEDTRLNLLKRKRTAMVAEIKLLHDARQQFPKIDQKCAGERAGCEAYAFALVDYADSWSHGRMVEEQVDSLMLALRHAGSVSDSEVALGQWNNLVGVPLDRLVAYHASGLKTEEIVALINTALLAWIGARQ